MKNIFKHGNENTSLGKVNPGDFRIQGSSPSQLTNPKSVNSQTRRLLQTQHGRARQAPNRSEDKHIVPIHQFREELYLYRQYTDKSDIHININMSSTSGLNLFLLVS